MPIATCLTRRDWLSEEIRRYNQTELNDNHVLQILGHELARQSDYLLTTISEHPGLPNI